jgi:hypothetical protein
MVLEGKHVTTGVRFGIPSVYIPTSGVIGDVQISLRDIERWFVQARERPEMVSPVDVALFLRDVSYIEYAATEAEELAHGIVAIDMDEGVYFAAFFCLDIRFDVPGLRLVSRMPSYGGGQRKLFLGAFIGKGVAFPRFILPKGRDWVSPVCKIRASLCGFI